MKSLLAKFYARPFIRYIFVAAGIVVLELIVFQLVYVAMGSYFWATILSVAVAVVINWFLSRKVVFGASQYHPAKEFLYVAITSVVGLGIQLVAVYICVSQIHLYPLLGKVISIFTSFFWNYWFRAHFIFNDRPTATTDETIERIDSSIF